VASAILLLYLGPYAFPKPAALPLAAAESPA
jgi:hypothetical protein